MFLWRNKNKYQYFSFEKKMLIWSYDILPFFFRMGLLDDELMDKRNTPIDTLSNYLSKRLAFGMTIINTVVVALYLFSHAKR